MIRPGSEVQLLYYHTVTLRHLTQLNLVQEHIFRDRLMRLHLGLYWLWAR
jgi:hypothetical protein